MGKIGATQPMVEADIQVAWPNGPSRYRHGSYVCQTCKQRVVGVYRNAGDGKWDCGKCKDDKWYAQHPRNRRATRRTAKNAMSGDAPGRERLHRGYELLEVLLVPHGGAHNDTIVTVERKVAMRGLFDE